MLFPYVLAATSISFGLLCPVSFPRLLFPQTIKISTRWQVDDGRVRKFATESLQVNLNKSFAPLWVEKEL